MIDPSSAKLSNWLRIYKADTSIGHWHQGHLLVAYRCQIVESFLEDIQQLLDRRQLRCSSNPRPCKNLQGFQIDVFTVIPFLGFIFRKMTPSVGNQAPAMCN